MTEKWQASGYRQLLALLVAGGILFLAVTGKGAFLMEQLKSIVQSENGISYFSQTTDDKPAQNNDTQGQKNVPGEDGTQDVNPEQTGGQDNTTVLDQGEEKPEIRWETVSEDYFDDALFIGDSRVVGLQDYGNLNGHATFYASTGLNIFRLLTARIALLEGQIRKTTVEDALGQVQFGKIYLMVGINELDIGTVERFQETYQKTIERIQELQPNAIIYIQSILKVTKKRSEKGDYIQNQRIIDRNEAIQKLADNERVFYLDVNEAVCDESGGMNPEYTSDGVHLKVKYIPLWREYLMNHAVVIPAQ